MAPTTGVKVRLPLISREAAAILLSVQRLVGAQRFGGALFFVLGLRM